MNQNNLITAASFTPNSLQTQKPWVGHLPFAAWVIKEISPKIFVELGTHTGNSYFSFCQSVVETGLSTKCYAVDTWQGDQHAGEYGDEIFTKVDAYHQEHYAGFSRLLRMTFDDAVNYFADESIELLHIDGLHTYDAVRHDFATWLPKLAPGAVVMFHDTNVRELNFGVWKLWEELQLGYPNNVEFVHSHGLGVLQLNNALDGKILPWLQLNATEKQRLINYFATLGSRQLERFELIELKQCTSNLSLAIADRDRQLASLNQVVADRDAVAAYCDTVVADRDALVTHCDAVTADRDAVAAYCDTVVADRDALVTHCDAVTADRDAVAAYCDTVVADRDALVTHCDAVTADRDAVAAYCDTVVADRDALVTHCDAVTAERDLQIATLNQALAKRGAFIDEILSSRSWCITYPLRTLKAFIVAAPSYLNRQKTLPKKLDVGWYMRQNPDVAQSNMDAHEHYALFGKAEHSQPTPDLFIIRNINMLKVFSKVAPIAVKRVGGIRKATQKTLKVVKQEGLEGLKSRLITYHQSQKPLVSLGTQSSCIILDKQQRYCLSKETTDYLYIPQRQPDNLTAIIASMEQQPVFSIIVPVYNTPPELLTKLLNSVTSQWYPHWQLILADDASPSVETQDDLAKINDSRIVVLSLPKNKGIAGVTNVALASATGEFVVLLDHDDELTDDCLFELARCINQENPDYIYSDEDKIRPDGQFSEPHFKPDWSPDTLMSTMYVCHVSCIRRSLLASIDGFRSDYDGCQDWDLMLRLTEKTDRISHIPKVLYHWRIIPASTAADITAKPYVLDASRRVREDTLQRRGLIGTVEPVEQVQGYFRVNYHLQGDPLISIIIPSRDNSVILRRCLDSIIEQSSYRHFELIIVDNGSVETATLTYLDQLRTQVNTTVIRNDTPFNFSELNNIGANIAQGDILLFLNDDTQVLSIDWLERMGGYAQLAHVGAVGAKLLYPGGNQIQHAGVLNLEDGPNHAFLRQAPDTPGYYMRNLLEYNWLAVTGACLMIERTKFQSIGGFDETFPIAYNDIDLCLCLRKADLYNVVCQSVRLIHHESVSRGLDHLNAVKRARLQQEKRHLFDKHPHYFQYDPFHNPNLHPNGIHFEVGR